MRMPISRGLQPSQRRTRPTRTAGTPMTAAKLADTTFANGPIAMRTPISRSAGPTNSRARRTVLVAAYPPHSYRRHSEDRRETGRHYFCRYANRRKDADFGRPSHRVDQNVTQSTLRRTRLTRTTGTPMTAAKLERGRVTTFADAPIAMRMPISRGLQPSQRRTLLTHTAGTAADPRARLDAPGPAPPPFP